MQNPQTMTTAEINLRIAELREFILNSAASAEFVALYNERQKRNIADAQEYWANWRNNGFDDFDTQVQCEEVYTNA